MKKSFGKKNMKLNITFIFYIHVNGVPEKQSRTRQEKIEVNAA